MGGRVVNFRFANICIGSLVRLTGEEQQLGKTTAFDIQLKPKSNAPVFRLLRLSRQQPSGSTSSV
jgi:geranylgeranyl pyrophosphate synthase